MILKILFNALTGYVLLCSIVFIFQRKLLYLPNKIQLSEDRAINEGLLYWPSFENFQGFISQGELVDPKGTIIVFHGNAGAAYHRSFYAKALSHQKLRVILAEYPGYGGRVGQPSEDVLVKDALETIRLAYQEYGGPLFVWGESLGGGVVSSAVSKTDIPIKGVVLFLPWDSLPNLAQTHYWYLPARWLVLDKYNNIDNLQGFEGNIAVILAENDEVVPVQHGKRLYDSITAKKKLWLFKDVRHNELPVEAELLWWKEVIVFISQ
ncbi:MAG: alpha/beta hydrolase [Desulfobacterales bacterium]|nr:alpha/beta hydrolase [Desulfobacterales bacterium]